MGRPQCWVCGEVSDDLIAITDRFGLTSTICCSCNRIGEEE